MEESKAVVIIDYTNWKGVRMNRKISPIRIFWGQNTYHPEEQYLLEAYDLDKLEIRYFAMKDVHSWNTQ